MTGIMIASAVATALILEFVLLFRAAYYGCLILYNLHMVSYNARQVRQLRAQLAMHESIGVAAPEPAANGGA